jgi:isoquinoline 1-oxidoreductase alpha subunit
MEIEMQLKINGQMKDVSGTGMLVWALRDELGMTGTKIGCGAGLCGACTVMVDGVATRSCSTPVTALAGKDIRTIEGLAAGGELHPVQQAFIDNQTPQCGWCMSGQIMNAAAFLDKNPDASEVEVVDAMSGNLCRCGCYVRIKSAVLQAQQVMQAKREEVLA